jgi:hypothetical protein
MRSESGHQHFTDISPINIQRYITSDHYPTINAVHHRTVTTSDEYLARIIQWLYYALLY